MSLISFLLLLPLLAVCPKAHSDGLDAIRRNFLENVLKADKEEGPFNLHVRMETTFCSPDIISVREELNEYVGLPHGRSWYHGRAFCRVEGQFRELAFEDLFKTSEQREWLCSYCESELREQPCSYLGGSNPLCTSLDFAALSSFIVDDHFFTILFQPYVVGGWADGPFVVTIPHEQLRRRWADDNPLALCWKRAPSNDRSDAGE
jgi:hypothetical protein